MIEKVLKKRAEESYLRADGSWTDLVTEAAVFENVDDAIRATQNQNLTAVDIVYLVTGNERGPLDVVLRLKD